MSVNGVLTEFFIILYIFISNTPPAINSGDNVTLSVIHGSNTATATLPMPENPGITAPIDGTSYDANIDNITVNWGPLGTTPDEIELYIEDTYTQSGFDYDVTLSGSATSHIIPSSTLKPGQISVPIEVYAVNSTTTFTGDVISGSMIEVEYMDMVTVNTN